jgi:hypothetical protein
VRSNITVLYFLLFRLQVPSFLLTYYDKFLCRFLRSVTLWDILVMGRFVTWVIWWWDVLWWDVSCSGLIGDGTFSDGALCDGPFCDGSFRDGTFCMWIYFFAILLLQRLLQKQNYWCFDFVLFKNSAICYIALFYLQLRAMQLSVKSKPKIFLLTPRYVTVRGMATPRYAEAQRGAKWDWLMKKRRVENLVRLSL